MAPLSVLILISGIIVLLLRWLRGRWLVSLSGRIGFGVMFVFAGLGHFVAPGEMAEMVPPVFARPDRWVAITGVLAILGGIGLLLPRTRKLAAMCLAVFLVTVFPANIYAAQHQVGIGGHQQGVAYLWFRAPLQLLYLVGVLLTGLRPSGWR
jgi:uncharacterized membrane protein